MSTTFGGIKDSAKLTFYDTATLKPILYFPYANSFSLSVSSEQAEAMANGAPKIKWSHSKSGTCTISAQVVPLKLLAMILGATSSNTTVGVNKNEVLTIASGTASINTAPKSGSLVVFTVEDDNKSLITELQSTVSAPTAGEYSITGTTITVNSALNGKKIMVFYVVDKTNTNSMKVKGTVFNSAVKIVGTSTMKLEDGTIKPIQITLPNATPQANSELTFSADTPSDFSMVFDLVADANDDMIIIEDI